MKLDAFKRLLSALSQTISEDHLITHAKNEARLSINYSLKLGSPLKMQILREKLYS